MPSSPAFALRCSPLVTGLLPRRASESHVLPLTIRMLSESGLRWSSVLERNGETAVGQEDHLMAAWWAFTKSPTAPERVKRLFGNLKALEQELGQEFEFGGPRASIKGRAGAEEDARHRAFYRTLADKEAKQQFFTARQVACRILGSTGYLCTDCWLPLGDCMCKSVVAASLWKGVKFWIYMHPKDFLRKNNTGKLLWQVFGPSSARLCIFGIPEQEAFMWDAFKQAGQDHVWCLFPEQSALDSGVQHMKIPSGLATDAFTDDSKEALHFILMDGTWSNSKAMISRIQDHAGAAWAGKSMPCVALNPDALSVMHGLRPQPSLDRTCTAAAAATLLRELHSKQELRTRSLDASADAVDASLNVLLEALAGRRRRVGRPEVRVGRHLF